MSQQSDDPEAIFATPRRTVFLTSEAAQQACVLATGRGIVIFRVEGGIRRAGGGFEMRLDAVWDGEFDPVDAEALATNNRRASNMIADDNEGCDAFVLSARHPVTHL